MKVIKLEVSEENEGPEDVALQKQLQEEKYLAENQEKIQDDQPLLFSRSYFLSLLPVFSSPYNLVVAPNDEVYKSSSLQEELESSHKKRMTRLKMVLEDFLSSIFLSCCFLSS